jgi:DNA-binding MurR/RpiR family transcriptional regulator
MNYFWGESVEASASEPAVLMATDNKYEHSLAVTESNDATVPSNQQDDNTGRKSIWQRFSDQNKANLQTIQHGLDPAVIASKNKEMWKKLQEQNDKNLEKIRHGLDPAVIAARNKELAEMAEKEIIEEAKYYRRYATTVLLNTLNPSM